MIRREVLPLMDLVRHFQRCVLWLRLSLGDELVGGLGSSFAAAILVASTALVLLVLPVPSGGFGLHPVLFRALAFQFGLFSGISVVITLLASGEVRRFGVGAVALASAFLEISLNPGAPRLGLALWAASFIGMICGLVAANRLDDAWRATSGVSNAEALAMGDAKRWFVRLHRHAPDLFDWRAFEAWMVQSRAHRAAYDRVEALWYGSVEADEAQTLPPPVGRHPGEGPARALIDRVAAAAPLFAQRLSASAFGDARVAALAAFWGLAIFCL